MIDTAIISRGGLGARLHLIARWLPKKILPVAVRPPLRWAREEARWGLAVMREGAGFRRVVGEGEKGADLGLLRASDNAVRACGPRA